MPHTVFISSSFIYPKREWVSSSANCAIPKVSFSTADAIEDFAITLGRSPHEELSTGAS
jgi:hypothetical protein